MAADALTELGGNFLLIIADVDSPPNQKFLAVHAEEMPSPDHSTSHARSKHIHVYGEFHGEQALRRVRRALSTTSSSPTSILLRRTRLPA